MGGELPVPITMLHNIMLPGKAVKNAQSYSAVELYSPMANTLIWTESISGQKPTIHIYR